MLTPEQTFEQVISLTRAYPARPKLTIANYLFLGGLIFQGLIYFVFLFIALFVDVNANINLPFPSNPFMAIFMIFVYVFWFFLQAPVFYFIFIFSLIVTLAIWVYFLVHFLKNSVENGDWEGYYQRYPNLYELTAGLILGDYGRFPKSNLLGQILAADALGKPLTRGIFLSAQNLPIPNQFRKDENYIRQVFGADYVLYSLAPLDETQTQIISELLQKAKKLGLDLQLCLEKDVVDIAFSWDFMDCLRTPKSRINTSAFESDFGKLYQQLANVYHFMEYLKSPKLGTTSQS